MSKKVEKLENTKQTLKFKTVKKVSGIPFHKFEIGAPSYIKFDSPIIAGFMKKKQANFANITNLETGEIQKILVSTVLLKLIEENYPHQTYIGKSFEVIKGEKVKGNENEYHEYDLSEVE